MSMRKTILAAGLAISALCAGAAFSADMNAIQQRQACMKANGKTMGALAAIMKGDTKYDAAVVTEAMKPMGEACGNWDKFWGDDTKPGGELAKATETWAKDEIWTDAEGFKKAGGDAYAAEQALGATTDEAGFKAAFGTVGGACKNCHEKFRKPKES